MGQGTALFKYKLPRLSHPRSGGLRSADAHEKPMSDGEALPIVPSWAWAIRYRPSLCRRLSLTFLIMHPRTLVGG